MSYNLVRHLPRYGFRGLNTLETIDLSYNDIREVDERAFDDMRWVTTLKVRWGSQYFSWLSQSVNIGHYIVFKLL